MVSANAEKATQEHIANIKMLILPQFYIT